MYDGCDINISIHKRERYPHTEHAIVLIVFAPYGVLRTHRPNVSSTL